MQGTANQKILTILEGPVHGADRVNEGTEKMHIGSIALDHPLVLAPMEDHTDRSFRRICKDLGADLVYTEFASSEALIRNAEKTINKIRVAEDERPIGIQLFGALDTSMTAAARVAESMEPDFIDINCGCWVKKVALRGAGAGLLKDIKAFEKVVRATMAGTGLPVTVKTRLGWDRENIIILEVARMLEDLGVAALAIHCRTRDAAHSGVPDWTWLERLKEAVNMPIIGNGGIHGPLDVKRMFETGCDGVMIGQAAIRYPWIFRDARTFLATGHLPDPPSQEERVTMCRRHLSLMVNEKGEKKGVMEFRKFYSHYLRGIPGIKEVRSELVTMKDMGEIMDRLEPLMV